MNVENVDVWTEPSRSRRWIWIAVAVGVAGGLGFAWYSWDQTQAHEAVVASAGRLTLEADAKADLKVIDRRGEPEVWYRVTLNDARDKTVLPIVCTWLDPAGNVHHRNKYDTQPITHADWETHARCKIGRDAKVGMWRVQMRVHRRTLHELTFEVRDGKEERP